MLRSTSFFSLRLVLALTALALPRCSSNSTITGEAWPALVVDPWVVQLPMATIAAGETGAFDVVLSNAGDRALTVAELTLEYATPVGASEATPALRLDRAALPVLPAVLGVPGSGQAETLVVTLLFTRLDDGFERTAELRIVSDDPGSPTLVVPVTASRPTPVLRVVPDVLDLGQLSEGEVGTREGTLRNSGSADLWVTGLLFTADHPEFVLTLDIDHVTKTFHPAVDGVRVALNPPLVLAPDLATAFQVTYTATEPSPASAQLVIFSNDPSAGPAGTLVQVRANQAGACLQVVPAEVDFGGKVSPGQYLLPVELRNCSTTQALTITRLDLDQGVDRCAGAFCLVVPAEVGSGAISAASPLVVEAGRAAVVNVVYAPTHAAEVDAGGQPVRDTATLVLGSDAFVARAEVPLSGFGVSDDCPVAVLTVQPGEEVLPQTVLHLTGASSYSNAGAIVKYQWSVEQPALSASKFVPSDSFPNPTFEANVLGKYVFHLDVWDEFGRRSCFAAQAQVVAATGCAIHVELLWTSPGDPDPEDEGPNAGTDLDLHFAHPNASQPDLDGNGQKDPWFDPSWDVFWFYPNQNWGSISSIEDNPTLDLDDVDGFGPENVNLCLPEDGKTYAVGVNTWDDHGYGQSFATVRIYLYGALVFEVNDVAMVDHDLCWIADLDWPSGQVKAKLTPGGGLWCTHDYHHPLFYQP